MEVQTAPPAPLTPVLSVPTAAQTPSAKASPTPPAAPAHAVQAAQPAPTASPTPSLASALPVQTAAPPTNPAVPALPPAPVAAPTTKTAPATDRVEGTKASATRDDEHAGEPDCSEEEEVVTRQIISLWAAREKKKTSLIKTKASLHTTKEQLSLMRAELGKHFFELKSLLAKPGRDGRWAEFLRDEGIPRASADRYAESHKRLVEGDNGNRLTEAISIPTEAEITKMVVKLTPRLVRALPTSECITQFLREMTDALQPSGLAA